MCPRLHSRRFGKDPSESDLFACWFRNIDREQKNKVSAKITKEVVTQAILDFFISGDIPFHQAENPYFKNLISLIRIPIENAAKDHSQIIDTNPATSPSRKVVRARLDEHVKKAKEQLRQELIDNDSKISLALDIWTGGANYAFMGLIYCHSKLIPLGVTAHWIDHKFCLREALLDFRNVQGDHKGINLGTILHNIIVEYGIQDKLFCCTSDNASNNGTTLEQLSVLIHESSDGTSSWEHTTHHIKCLSHVLNLACQDFIKVLKGI